MADLLIVSFPFQEAYLFPKINKYRIMELKVREIIKINNQFFPIRVSLAVILLRS